MLFDSAVKEQFQEIRCFDDTEVPRVLSELDESKRLQFVFSQLFPGEHVDTSPLFECKTVKAIQTWIIQALVPKLESTYQHINISGFEEIDPSVPHLFVSNHRDIAMDPILVNLALKKSGFETAHNAIGDNLLLSVTGTRMALLNKCFRVARSVRTPKAMLLALRKQAQYIRFLHADLGQNVWIAQREGRALDGIDTTNPALLKMLTLGVTKSEAIDTLNDLRICPVTISYEWDPCDMSKAKRVLHDKMPDSDSALLMSADAKLANDKLDILTGLLGYKGRIAIHASGPMTFDYAERPFSEAVPDIANAIDHKIHHNYEIFPINRACSQIVERGFRVKESTPPNLSLSEEESKALDTLLTRLDLSISDIGNDALLQEVLRAYAQPVSLKNLCSRTEPF